MLKLQETIFNFPEINLFFDFSKSAFNLSFIKDNALIIENSLREMAALESGAIANPSEQRMVGHYWLRDGSLAPIPEIRSEIASLYEDIAQFAQSVISGKIKSPAGTKFKKILLIGIGGSALGPQFMARAFEGKAPLEIFFFDNTDPAGFELTLKKIGDLKDLLFLRHHK